MSENLIPWTPALITRRLLFAMAAIVAASSAIRAVVHLTGHDYIYGLVPLLYVDKEQNIPTLFSVALLLADALALGMVTSLEAARGSRWTPAWRTLSLGFVLIAADEFMGFHELLTSPIRRAANGAAGGLFHYGWVAVGAPVALLVAACYYRFVRQLPKATQRAFVIAGACYVGGAVGIEVLGGLVAAKAGDMSVAHSVLATVEETMEMTGCILFLRGILEYANREHHGILNVVATGADR